MVHVTDTDVLIHTIVTAKMLHFRCIIPPTIAAELGQSENCHNNVVYAHFLRL